MNVLLVNSIFWGGGVDSQTLTLARALVRRGASVLLAVPANARLLPLARAEPGLQVATVETGRAGWPFALARLARAHRADIVHAHHGRDYWIAILASRLPGVHAAAVVTRHLMTPLSPSSRRYLGRFARVIAVSAAVEASLQAQGFGPPGAVRRIACGIDTETFCDRPGERELARSAWGFDERAFTFALVANANPPEGKGHLYYVEAAAQVVRVEPQARFFCVGGGFLVPVLREKAASLGVLPNFRFVEFTDDWARQLPGIDVLVHPAVGSEALGLVILEALSASRAVIASRLDGIPETMRDPEHGRLVPPRDARALAEAMRALAFDRAKTREMGRRGRDWVLEHYSMERLASETLQLYAQARGA